MTDEDELGKYRPSSETRETIFRFFSGGRGSRGGSVVDKLIAAYGPGPRGGQVNVTRAAQGLGVHPSTVRNWVKGINRPNPANRRKISRHAAAAPVTKRGRRAALSTARTKSRRTRTAMIRGRQGGPGPDYVRANRVATLENLTPRQQDAMFAAYEAGGEEGFIEWAKEHLSEHYVDDWLIEDIDSVDWR